MATQETKVKVRLDTRQAKGEMRGLVKESSRMAARAGAGIRSAVGRGLGVIGLGAGVGTAVAAVRGATQSGIGDVISESLGGYGVQLERWALGDLALDARASRTAREQTVQNFAQVVGTLGTVPPAVKQYYENVKTFQADYEKGRRLLEDPKSGLRGPSIDELIKRIGAVLKDLLFQAAEHLASKLNPINWIR